ncbi:conserved protein, unknown function [Hepatocystis sp. ex Piliocolobus tephrosceles]|nr:conserved protein, unknown function [Hepatocystis sp. ex Piliocolobus tephrosceles]
MERSKMERSKMENMEVDSTKMESTEMANDDVNNKHNLVDIVNLINCEKIDSNKKYIEEKENMNCTFSETLDNVKKENNICFNNSDTYKLINNNDNNYNNVKSDNEKMKTLEEEKVIGDMIKSMLEKGEGKNIQTVDSGGSSNSSSSSSSSSSGNDKGAISIDDSRHVLKNVANNVANGTKPEHTYSLEKKETEKQLLDIYLKDIFENDINTFNAYINNLNENELKQKIIEMFTNGLLSDKYMNTLIEEKKRELINFLTVKYDDIYLKKKAKLKKMMNKKLRKEEKALEHNYEKAKITYEHELMKKLKEEIYKEKKKLENNLEQIKEEYLQKINLHSCDMKYIKDKIIKEQIVNDKLKNVNATQQEVMLLQNLLIHDMSIESTLNNIKTDLEKDLYLKQILNILPYNFFSCTYKPTKQNDEKIKKEFYNIYKISVKEAFLDQNNYFLKNIFSSIMCYLFINYNSTVNTILTHIINKNELLKSNLLNLSYALNSIEQNKYIETLQYIDGLKGNCKQTFEHFNENVKNSIFLKFYLRLAVSRLMLKSKSLMSC